MEQMKDLTRITSEPLKKLVFPEERAFGYFKRLSGRFSKGFDITFLAVTFAEAGDFETARDSSTADPETVGIASTGAR